MDAPSTRGLRRRDAQRNREQILATARTLFARDGLDVSVEEITTQAGLGVGTLYRHFPTRDDLVEAVLEEALQGYVDLAAQAATDENAWTGFTTFLQQALNLHATNRGLRDALATSDHGRALAQATRARIRPTLTSLVERAQAEGTLRPDFRPEDVTVIFWAVARIIDAADGTAPNLWRRYLSLLLDGLRTTAATQLPMSAPTPAQLARMAFQRAG